MEFIKKILGVNKKIENKKPVVIGTGKGKVRREIVPISECTYDKGVYYGINKNTNTRIYYDKTKLMTGHELILGINGSGKSNLCKNELKAIYKNTDDAIIVIQDETEAVGNEISVDENDPSISYSSLAELYNENHIRVPDYCFNPFELYRTGNEIMDQSILFRKDEFIMNLMSSINGSELSVIQISLIDKIIKNIYADYNNEAAPTISTFICELKKQKFQKELKNIIDNLENKLNIGLDNFERKGKIELNSRFTVYSMYGVKSKIYNQTVLILLESIWNTIVNNCNKGIRTHIVIDCIDNLFVDKFIGRFILNMVKRLRVNGGMITLICTDPKQILKNEDYHYNILVENLETIRILSQREENLELICEFFKIPRNCTSYFHRVERGTGLLLNYKLMIPFKYIMEKSNNRIDSGVNLYDSIAK